MTPAHPLTSRPPDIAAMPHQKVAADAHGKTVAFEGVQLRLLLEKAGVTFGESLRGRRLSSCLRVEAADGYRAVVALPELDPAFTDRVILLTDRAEDNPLDNKEGAFRIVIPGERMARWVRQVICAQSCTGPMVPGLGGHRDCLCQSYVTLPGVNRRWQQRYARLPILLRVPSRSSY
jgi:hypothetical protein